MLKQSISEPKPSENTKVLAKCHWGCTAAVQQCQQSCWPEATLLCIDIIAHSRCTASAKPVTSKNFSKTLQFLGFYGWQWSVQSWHKEPIHSFQYSFSADGKILNVGNYIIFPFWSSTITRCLPEFSSILLLKIVSELLASKSLWIPHNSGYFVILSF